MAIAAMEQYGWFIASFGISTMDMLATPQQQQFFFLIGTSG